MNCQLNDNNANESKNNTIISTNKTTQTPNYTDLFTHYSFKIIEHFIPTTQVKPTSETYGIGKPDGLFVSRGSKWMDWCESENFFPEPYLYLYEVKVDPESKILTITTDNLESFITEYNVESKTYKTFPQFDWEKVAETYDGVHFTQNVMDLVKGDNRDFKTRMKYLFLCSYDVETLVLWKGNHQLNLLQKL